MKSRKIRGFTLIELLVVISIIALLVAILIPVISKMRIAANTASTHANMVQISQAIQNYYNDYQAYPGMMPDVAFSNPPSPISNAATLTSSEDLVLALMGGLDITQGANNTIALTFKSALLGKGPISLNPRNPGQHTAYMEPRPAMMTEINQTHASDNRESLNYVTTDSPVPEFVDAYSDGRPLLYVRANLAAKRQTDQTKIVNFSNTYDPAAYYNFRSVQAYIRPFDPAIEARKGNDVFQFPIRPADQQQINDYFVAQNIVPTNPVSYAARGAGTYLLISAGPDRRFGTPDDIIISGGGAQ